MAVRPVVRGDPVVCASVRGHVPATGEVTRRWGMELEGKVAIVTGGTGNIGSACMCVLKTHPRAQAAWRHAYRP